MGACQWCGKEGSNLTNYSTLGNSNLICEDCLKIVKSGKCRVCGGPLGSGSFAGKCLICTQLEYSENKRKEEEESAGVDTESLNKYSSGSEFTEADYEHWLTSGQGNFTPQKRAETRAKWLVRRLSDEPGWTNVLIAKHIGELFRLMDAKFDAMLNRNKYQIVILDGTKEYKNIIYRVNSVAIVAR